MQVKPILISFSGGRTSAFMAKLLIEHQALSDRQKVVCFANTGKEFEATLDFVNECDVRWNLNVVWLEAVVNPEKGKGTTFKVVNYETAARNGEPFEAVIAKYGIPNKQFPHCTKELKIRPIKKYMYSIGYRDFVTALGIRSDEKHRLGKGAEAINPYYPLAGELIDTDEKFIRAWWDRQDFDLELKDYESNCDLCWKKSKRKRLTLIYENENVSDWWNEMEARYGKGDYQFDQREGLTIPDLIENSITPFCKSCG